MIYHLDSCPGFCAGCSSEFLAERARVSSFLNSLRLDGVLLSFARSIIEARIQRVPVPVTESFRQPDVYICDM